MVDGYPQSYIDALFPMSLELGKSVKLFYMPFQASLVDVEVQHCKVYRDIEVIGEAGGIRKAQRKLKYSIFS